MATVSSDVAIPEVWAAQVLAKLQKTLVFAGPGVVNRDYEGDIAGFGDTVRIISVGDPTIGDYEVNDTITWESVSDSSQSLEISQSKSFSFKLDDVIMRQARNGGALMDETAVRAAYGLRDAMDAYVASVMDAGVSASNPDNDLGAKTVTTAAGAYDLLVDLAVALDEANVPEVGRFVVVPPNFHGLIRKDTRFIATGDMASTAARLNGQIGEAAGLAVLKSNNAPTDGGARVVIAGYAGATTVAENINSVETVRLPDTFATGLRGLHLYGAKVTRPSGLAKADVTISLAS